MMNYNTSPFICCHTFVKHVNSAPLFGNESTDIGNSNFGNANDFKIVTFPFNAKPQYYATLLEYY